MTRTLPDATPADRAETLSDLRVEIDRIDADMHQSLIARGAIIDRLIAVKARAGGGSAFRPDREASMMRHIAERHRGRLPVDTVEGIWRIIISTFTHVQAAYAVHADGLADDAAMRDSARFHFGFTVPLHLHPGPAAVIAAVQNADADLGLVRLNGGAAAGPWWRLLAEPDAPKVIARLPFVERPDHPAGTPVVVVALPSAATPATEVLLFSLWVDRWRDGIAEVLASRGGEILQQAAAAEGLAMLVSLPGERRAATDSRRAARLGPRRDDGRCPDRARRQPRGALRFFFRRSGLIQPSRDPPTMSIETVSRPVPRDGILAIEAYVPGKSAVAPGVKLHKLSSNENPLGPFPEGDGGFRRRGGKARALPRRGRHAAARGHRPPLRGRPSPDRLRVRLGRPPVAARLQLHRARRRGHLHGPRLPHLPHRHPGRGRYPRGGAGARLHRGRRCHPGPRHPSGPASCFLANPNNPTGTYLPFSEVKRLHAGLPPRVLLVLDAAYAEYVRNNDYSSGLELAATADNVVMTRTFSKIHGLAALRVGWAFAPAPVCDALNRIRGAFNVNLPAIEAGIAAMEDREHEDAAVVHNARWAAWLTEELGGLGLSVVPSVGNFLLVGFPEGGPYTAEAADRFLAAHGLVLRAVASYGLPHHLRLTVGTEEANRLVVATLKRFFAAPSCG